MNSITFHRVINGTVLAWILLCSACGNPAFRKAIKGMEVYGKKEFWYSLETDNPNKPKPSSGDLLEIDYTLQRGNEILNSSYETGSVFRVPIPAEEYDNFFTKALRLMGEGDSLSVIIKPEVMGQEYLGVFYEEFGENDWVTCTYKNRSIITSQELAAQKSRELAYIDSIRQSNIQLIQFFKKGQLKDQLSKTPKGVQYLIQEEGKGDLPTKEDIIHVNYMGYLMNGDMIQDSYLKDQAMQVSWGKNAVIPGWLEALPLLREGASGLFFMPAPLAYGEIGVEGIIPPNAALVFYIKVEYIERM